MNTTVVLQKKTQGEKHLRGDREISYSYTEEFYYSHEMLYNDSKLDHFFIDISCSEYLRLQIHTASPFSLLKVVENQYHSLLELENIDFKIEVRYHSIVQSIKEYDGYTGHHTPENRTTLKIELEKIVEDKNYFDMAHSIEFKLLHS